MKLLACNVTGKVIPLENSITKNSGTFVIKSGFVTFVSPHYTQSITYARAGQALNAAGTCERTRSTRAS